MQTRRRAGAGGNLPKRWLAAGASALLVVVGLPLLALTTAAPADAATHAAGDLFPLTPARIADLGTLGAGTTKAVAVAGHGGVPASGAAAVLLTISVLSPTKSTSVTVWPTGTARPGRATVTAVAGRSVTNTALVRLGRGKVSVRNSSGSAHVTVDVQGWVSTGAATASGGRIVPLNPALILDTKAGVGAAKRAVGAGKSIAVPVGGHGGVPTGSAAATLTVTATAGTKAAKVTVWPTGRTRPKAPTLYVPRGRTVADTLLARLGKGGKVSFYAAGGAVQLTALAQAAGTTAASAGTKPHVQPLRLARIADTATGTGTAKAKLTKPRTITVAGRGGVPSGARGVFINLTALHAGKTSLVTVWPAGAKRPTKPNLVVYPKSTATAFASVRLPISGTSKGRMKIAATVAVDLGIDVEGAALPPTAALAVTTSSLPDAAQSAAYTQTLHASGGYGAYRWQLASGTLPVGLSLSPAGVVSGTPTGSGTSAFTVRVLDANSTAATRALSITVTVPGGPQVTTSSLPGGVVGTAYNAALAATGGALPYSWDKLSGTLPPGLSLGSDGVIDGTPTTAGSYDVTVRVTDSGSLTATHGYTIVIASVSSPSITTTTLPGGSVDTPYDQFVDAAGGATPYFWEISAGTLPDGLLLDSSAGEILGTPTTPGTNNFTVKVTDNNAKTDTQALSISIVGFSITTTSLPGGTVGVNYSQTIQTANGTAPVTFAVTTGSLPAGLSLDQNTGAITGKPTTNGTSNFTITASDSAFHQASKALSITVTTSSTPIITTTALPGGEVGVPYGATVSSIGGTTPYTWSLVSGNLPAGVTMSNHGVFSGSPSGTGLASFTVKVTDANNANDTQALSINVTADSDWPQPGRDAGGRRYAPSESVVTANNIGDLHEVWSMDKTSDTPAVAGGVLYTAGGVTGGGTDNALMATSLTTGDVLWQVTTPCAGTQVAVTSTEVIFPCNGEMRAYDRNNDHALLWSADNVDPNASVFDFAVLSDRVIAWSATAVRAYSLTGDVNNDAVLLWQIPGPGNFITDVAATETTTVIASGSWLRGVYSKTANGHTGGALAWPDKAFGANNVVIDGSSAYSVYNGALRKLVVDTGVEQWALTSAPAGDPTITPADVDVVLGGDGTNVYVRWIVYDEFGTATNKLVALKESDGTLAWAVDAPPRLQYATTAGSILYVTWRGVGSNEPNEGGVRAYKASDGTDLGSVINGPRLFTPLVAAEGRLAVAWSSKLQVLGFDPKPPIITTKVLPPGHTGVSYSTTLQATGDSTPFTWTVASGSLPNGLTMSTAGVISGTPTLAGMFTFVIRVTDALGVKREHTFAIEVTGSTPTPWLSVGGDSDRRGYGSGETAFSTGASASITQKWVSAQIGTPGNYDVAGDFAITSSYAVVPEYQTGTLKGFPLTSGLTSGRLPAWTGRTDEDPNNPGNFPLLVSGVSVSSDGHAVVLGADGLYSFDATNGNKQWKVPAPINTFNLPAPTIVGTKVVVSINNDIYAYNLSDGSVAWGPVTLVPRGQFFGLNIISSFATDGTRVFVVNGCTIYALNLSNGSAAWDHDIAATGADNCGAFSSDSIPLVNNNVVYVGSYGGTSAFNATTGAVVWQRGFLSGGQMALAGGVLVTDLLVAGTSSYTPEPMGVDATTGDTLWTNTSYANAYPARYAVAGDLVFTPTSDGSLSMLSLTTGDRVNFTAAQSGGGQLVLPVGVYNGRVYTVGYDGKLRAFGSA